MSKEVKLRIIKAGHKAVDELIKVAEDSILNEGEGEELSADRLKNAAATKKLAIFDAFEILQRIEAEKEIIALSEKGQNSNNSTQGFAERRSRKK